MTDSRRISLQELAGMADRPREEIGEEPTSAPNEISLRLKGALLEAFAYTIRGGAWDAEDQAMENRLEAWYRKRLERRNAK
jgi:hypothetical protein